MNLWKVLMQMVSHCMVTYGWCLWVFSFNGAEELIVGQQWRCTWTYVGHLWLEDHCCTEVIHLSWENCIAPSGLQSVVQVSILLLTEPQLFATLELLQKLVQSELRHLWASLVWFARQSFCL